MERMVCQDFSFSERLSPFSFIIFNIHAKERAQNTRELRPSTPENASEDVSHLTWLAPSTTAPHYHAASSFLSLFDTCKETNFDHFWFLYYEPLNKPRSCGKQMKELLCIISLHVIASSYMLTSWSNNRETPEPLCHDIQVFERHKTAKGQMFFGSSLVPSFCLP